MCRLHNSWTDQALDGGWGLICFGGLQSSCNLPVQYVRKPLSEEGKWSVSVRQNWNKWQPLEQRILPGTMFINLLLNCICEKDFIHYFDQIIYHITTINTKSGSCSSFDSCSYIYTYIHTCIHMYINTKYTQTHIHIHAYVCIYYIYTSLYIK